MAAGRVSSRVYRLKDEPPAIKDALNELAAKVRLAIKIYRNEHSPNFVPLPVTVR